MMRQHLAALRRARQRQAPGPVEITILDRDPRTPPRFRPDGVAEDSQLWLWHQDPTEPAVARRNRQWPDEVLHLGPDLDQVLAMTGAALETLATASDQAAEQRERERRAATRVGRQLTTLDSCQITSHRNQETDTDGALISILDPCADQPARRLLGDGTIEPLDGCPRGLTVYGRHQADRPSFADASLLPPDHAYLLSGVRENRGTTVGI